MLNRRSFIKTVSATSAGLCLAPEILINVTNQNDKGVTLFNHINGEKLVLIMGDELVTPAQIHRFLQEFAQTVSGMKQSNPSVRHTENIITLLNGWDIEEEDWVKIAGGSISIEYTGEMYTGMTKLGFSEEDIDNTNIIVGQKVYNQQSFLANIENKEVFVTNGDKSYNINEIVNRDQLRPFHGNLMLPSLHMTRI